MQKNRQRRRMRAAFKRISLVDRLLILFLLILFADMAYHLLCSAVSPGGVNSIDVIIRTSAASIFGYFISSNFLGQDAPSSSVQVGNLQNTASGPAPASGAPTVENRIGFQEGAAAPEPEPGGVSLSRETPAAKSSCKTIQVFVVAAIGLLSLVTLLAAKSCTELAPELSAIVSQLRDFVSACIGFLISCGRRAGP